MKVEARGYKKGRGRKIFSDEEGYYCPLSFLYPFCSHNILNRNSTKKHKSRNDGHQVMCHLSKTIQQIENSILKDLNCEEFVQFMCPSGDTAFSGLHMGFLR